MKTNTFAAVNVPALLGPAEPCPTLGMPVPLSARPCNIEKQRHDNSCVNTWDGLSPALPHLPGPVAPRAQILQPDREFNVRFHVSIWTDIQGLRDPISDGHGEGGHGGGRLEKSVHNPILPALTQPAACTEVLRPWLGNYTLYRLTQEACQNVSS